MGFCIKHTVKKRINILLCVEVIKLRKNTQFFHSFRMITVDGGRQVLFAIDDRKLFSFTRSLD